MKIWVCPENVWLHMTTMYDYNNSFFFYQCPSRNWWFGDSLGISSDKRFFLKNLKIGKRTRLQRDVIWKHIGTCGNHAWQYLATKSVMVLNGGCFQPSNQGSPESRTWNLPTRAVPGIQSVQDLQGWDVETGPTHFRKIAESWGLQTTCREYLVTWYILVPHMEVSGNLQFLGGSEASTCH